MMKKHRYRVNTFVSCCALITACLLLGTAIYILQRQMTVPAVVFAGFSVMFLFISAKYGAVVEISEEGVQYRCLGRKPRFVAWSDIAEVGIVGLRLFKPKDSNKSGTKYIYMSSVKMTDEERFNMCLKWPPANAIYFSYHEKRYHALQFFWNNTIETFNVDDELL